MLPAANRVRVKHKEQPILVQARAAAAMLKQHATARERRHRLVTAEEGRRKDSTITASAPAKSPALPAQMTTKTIRVKAEHDEEDCAEPCTAEEQTIVTAAPAPRPVVPAQVTKWQDTRVSVSLAKICGFLGTGS